MKEYADKYDDQLGVEIDLEKEKERADKAERRVKELDGAIIGWKIVEKTLKERLRKNILPK